MLRPGFSELRIAARDICFEDMAAPGSSPLLTPRPDSVPEVMVDWLQVGTGLCRTAAAHVSRVAVTIQPVPSICWHACVPAKGTGGKVIALHGELGHVVHSGTIH